MNAALAGAGAVALGYDATTRSGTPAGAPGPDTGGEDGRLRCSVCGQPIRPGQRRKPTPDNEVVHEACTAQSQER